ncbi:MarR family transcriptional regulator [Anaerofustis stercorihominis]|uniref:Transcriptional regulator, MarR family n=1 Tax=Anaerofustis stercorihominis DSM 17244 TaxID=445971 RepID=B1CC60_9FIRM|nr:MarR family transcriptional regulator [Anaerofustis stercorihominis]EDS71857.1 transcriptional regulator, MarR family [Anaerofustis stercorihominis DSM 17244]MCQ4796090.1 MarR family transcriptional regulator [Anaerofustis stercorihominis]
MKTKKDIGRIINILSNELKKSMNKDAACYGVTGIQSKVLYYISKQKSDIFQKDIEAQFHTSRATASGLLQLLEENGLIRRECVDYDARLKKIIITQKGLDIKESIGKEIDKTEAKLKLGISDDEIDTFLKVCDKMLINLR